MERITHLVDVIRSDSSNQAAKIFAMEDINQLADTPANRALLGAPSLGLIQLLVEMIRENDDLYYIIAIHIIMKVSIASEIKAAIGSPSVGLISFLTELARRGDPNAFLILGNLSYCKELAGTLLDARAHDVALECFRNQELSDCLSTSIYLLMTWSRTSFVARAVRQAGGIELISPYLSHNGVTRLQVGFILVFLMGRDESILSRGQSLLEVYPDLIGMLVQVFEDTIEKKVVPEYFYGTFGIPCIVSAVLCLSISDMNRSMLIKTSILPLLIKVLQFYSENTDELRAGGGSSVGGGNDTESAELAIESLLQLSFHYEDDTLLKSKYMVPSLGIVPLLESILRLGPERKDICDLAKQNASNLIQRLTNQSDAASSPTSDECKHIMISYNHSVKKEYVIELERILRAIGYNVWRDECGSSLVSQMGGHTDSKMAEAIELSAFVIICVSLAYKESANCRMEANYANQLAKKGILRTAFVMMQSDYTTVSSPHSVDGWLGFMVGDALWYPMWEMDMVPKAAADLSKIFSESGKMRVHPPATVFSGGAGGVAAKVTVPVNQSVSIYYILL